MCDLCAIRDKVLHGEEFKGEIFHCDGLCLIVDSPLEKAGKDGFQPKVCIYRQHELEPLPPIKDAIMNIAKRMFRKRTFWFPQAPKGKMLPREEWPAHWYFIIE